MQDDVMLWRRDSWIPAPYRRDLEGEQLIYELQLCLRNHVKPGEALLIPFSFMIKAGRAVNLSPMIPWPALVTYDQDRQHWRILRTD